MEFTVVASLCGKAVYGSMLDEPLGFGSVEYGIVIVTNILVAVLGVARHYRNNGTESSVKFVAGIERGLFNRRNLDFGIILFKGS